MKNVLNNETSSPPSHNNNVNTKLTNFFIAFYGVMGTLAHSKIILELLLQNDRSESLF